VTEIHIPQIKKFIEHYGRNWKEHVDRIPPPQSLKISVKRRK
jgi:hypothetical protein